MENDFLYNNQNTIVVVGIGLVIVLIIFAVFFKLRHKVKLTTYQKWVILATIITISLVSLWFYWYQYRPSQIRSECNAESLEIVTDRYGVRWGEYDFAYKACLRSKGLK